jgi:hypothetical protein
MNFPPPLQPLNPAVSAELEMEIRRALEKDPTPGTSRAIEMKREPVNATHIF